MKSFTVSVIVITYNHENFIEESICSILKQRVDFEFELIISNDCSTDNTNKVIETIISKHTNDKISISYFNHEKNLGMMPNFIFALNKSKGDFIALCDGDDYWIDPFKLKKQVGFLVNNPDYVACFHPAKFKIGNNQSLTTQNLNTIKYEYNIQNILQYWAIPTASMVIKRTQVFSNLPDWYKELDSGELPLLLFHIELGKFKLFEEYMSVYRKSGLGVSNSHNGAKMIHYRAKIHVKLNEYFDYKYENEIYKALDYLMGKHLQIERPNFNKPTLRYSLKNKLRYFFNGK